MKTIKYDCEYVCSLCGEYYAKDDMTIKQQPCHNCGTLNEPFSVERTEYESVEKFSLIDWIKDKLACIVLFVAGCIALIIGMENL